MEGFFKAPMTTFCVPFIAINLRIIAWIWPNGGVFFMFLYLCCGYTLASACCKDDIVAKTVWYRLWRMNNYSILLENTFTLYSEYGSFSLKYLQSLPTQLSSESPPFLPFLLEITTGHQDKQGPKIKMVQIETAIWKESIERSEQHLKKCP